MEDAADEAVGAAEAALEAEAVSAEAEAAEAVVHPVAVAAVGVTRK